MLRYFSKVVFIIDGIVRFMHDSKGPVPFMDPSFVVIFLSNVDDTEAYALLSA